MIISHKVNIITFSCSGDRGGYGGGGGGGGGARGPSVFVGNIPWAASENELRDLFGGCGQVSQFRILVDRETNRSRGTFSLFF